MAVINPGVTSVATAGTVNGITLTGGPITSRGTVTLGGTLDLSSPPAIGSTAANTGAFTTLSASSTVSGTGFDTYLASPPAIGGTTAAAGTFTTLTATGQTSLGGVTLGSGNVDVFTVAIDVDTINEEVVFITAQASDTMTIVRGRAGTSAVTHTAGASVKHVLTSYDLTNFESGLNETIPLNAQTGTSYTFVATDAGYLVTLTNAAAIALTVPLNSSVPFTIGTQITITQGGVGTVTVAGAVGVTINSADGDLKLRSQWSSATLIKIATNSWILIGDIKA